MISYLKNNQLLKYIVVGISNTGITALVIFLLMFFNFGIYFSNCIGYIVGIIFSFLSNSIFTFTIRISISRFIKFIVCCGFCYLINLFILYLCLPYYGSYISQILGMIAYTISGFLINKIWVMK